MIVEMMRGVFFVLYKGTYEYLHVMYCIYIYNKYIGICIYIYIHCIHVRRYLCFIFTRR